MSRLIAHHARRAWRSLTAFAALIAACDGASPSAGFEQPLRVRSAQFIEGELPGRAPLSKDEITAGVEPIGPRVTFVDTANRVIPPSKQAHKLAGRTTTDGAAVAIKLAELGAGYWLLPVAGPDPLNGNELTWSTTADFSDALPLGLHKLRFAAVDAEGASGTQSEIEVCFVPPYDDNLNACDPSNEPPAAVLTLSWDTEVDLDLRLLTPTGKVVEAKSPTTVVGTGGITGQQLNAPETGHLDRDSNGGCVIDGQRRESIVWKGTPRPGNYQIYANLFDACGQKAAHYSVTLLLSEPSGPDGKRRLVEKLIERGTFTAIDANGGAGPGTFVGEFELQ